MPVNVAIVGPAGSGKTTLFNALTAGRGADGVGMVDIPDARLTRLAEAVKPAKTTPAQVRVEDTPPGSRAQRVAFARQADVLLKVARCFGPEPDPVAELEEFSLDLEPDQRGMLLGILPVTLKPAVYVANAAEELLPGGGEPAARVKKLADDE